VVAGRVRRFVLGSRARRAAAGATAALVAGGLFAGCFAPAPAPTARRDTGTTTTSAPTTTTSTSTTTTSTSTTTTTTTTTTTSPFPPCFISVALNVPSATVEVHTQPVLANVPVALHRDTPAQDLSGTTDSNGVATFVLVVTQPTLLHATVDGTVQCDGHIS
jgi:hypothetical protein